MFARVIHFDVRSECIQQGYRAILEHVTPASRCRMVKAAACSSPTHSKARCSR
jgi:hypothetical protein